MVELTQTNGRKLAVTPAQVVSIEDNGNSTLVLLSTRNEARVTESYADVLAWLKAFHPNPVVAVSAEPVASERILSESAEAPIPAANPRKRETK